MQTIHKTDRRTSGWEEKEGGTKQRESKKLMSQIFSRRKFLKSSAAIGMLSTMASPLVASPSQAQEPKRGGHLKLALNGGATTDSLDPATYTSMTSVVLGRTWGDTLVETHPDTGAAVPALAESWSSSPDAKEWTFKIRKGVRFHDGKEVTAADCAQTIKRHSDENSKSGAAGVLTSIKTIEDRSGELVIGLSDGNADLPMILTDYHLIVQPNGGYDSPTAAIGTGPYRLGSFQPGVRVTFEKNLDDWRSDRGYVDSVEILIVKDTTARIAAISSGNVHFINSLEPKTVSLLERAPNLEILRTSGKGFYCFLAHCDAEPFTNNDLRLALKYAVDRQEILDRVLGGYGTLGNDYPVNGNYALAPEGIEQRTYDPEKAAFHYKKSGHSGPIVLSTSGAAFPGALDAAVLYQESAKKAGLDLQVRREPDDGYWNDVWNVKPFSAAHWGGRPTQDSRYTTAFLSSAEWNDTRFMRPDFDALVTSARSELDEAKRKEAYQTAAVMVRDEGGLILPVFNDYLNAAVSNLKGFVHDIGNDMSNGYVTSRVWFDA